MRSKPAPPHTSVPEYFSASGNAEVGATSLALHQRRDYRPGQTHFQLPAVQRFYGSPNAGLDSHFFTIDYADQFALTYGPLSSAWVLEVDNAFEIGRPDQDGNCLAGQIPVYRLWNRRVDSNHRYTTNPAIKSQMIERGYVAEGYGPDVVDMCAPVRALPVS